jgi:hypothetical protein
MQESRETVLPMLVGGDEIRPNAAGEQQRQSVSLAASVVHARLSVPEKA